jgi:hypothetical protein
MPRGATNDAAVQGGGKRRSVTIAGLPHGKIEPRSSPGAASGRSPIVWASHAEPADAGLGGSALIIAGKRVNRPLGSWSTMDKSTAIAPTPFAFRQAAQQRSEKAKGLASAWKPPGSAPTPNVDLIELRHESLAARDPLRSDGRAQTA